MHTQFKRSKEYQVGQGGTLQRTFFPMFLANTNTYRLSVYMYSYTLRQPFPLFSFTSAGPQQWKYTVNCPHSLTWYPGHKMATWCFARGLTGEAGLRLYFLIHLFIYLFLKGGGYFTFTRGGFTADNGGRLAYNAKFPLKVTTEGWQG